MTTLPHATPRSTCASVRLSETRENIIREKRKRRNKEGEEEKEEEVEED